MECKTSNSIFQFQIKKDEIQCIKNSNQCKIKQAFTQIMKMFWNEK